MSALDLSWRLLKAPVYDTDISGIRFVTQGKDEADWSKDPTVYGADMGPLSHVPEEEDVLGDIRMITPNQFLAMTSKEGMDESSPYYEDLMDRAQAGEPLVFGMPYINLDKDGKHLLQDGRHRMAELLARGDKKVPVLVQREPVQRRIR